MRDLGKELPIWLLAVLSWLLAAYFLFAFAQQAGFPPTADVGGTVLLYLGCGLLFLFLPFFHRLKIANVIELDRTVRRTRSELLDFRAEVRNSLAVMSASVGPAASMKQTLNVGAPSSIDLHLDDSPAGTPTEVTSGVPERAPVVASSTRRARTVGRDAAGDGPEHTVDLGSEARLWKFSYLSILYVWNTKKVLNWFKSAVPGDRSQYETVWSPVIPDETERAIILSVLQGGSLLEETDGRYYVTDEGDEFLKFVGLPPLGPPVKRD